MDNCGCWTHIDEPGSSSLFFKKAINPLTVPIMFTLAYCKPIHYSDKTKKAIYIFGQMHTDPL